VGWGGLGVGVGVEGWGGVGLGGNGPGHSGMGEKCNPVHSLLRSSPPSLSFLLLVPVPPSPLIFLIASGPSASGGLQVQGAKVAKSDRSSPTSVGVIGSSSKSVGVGISSASALSFFAESVCVSSALEAAGSGRLPLEIGSTLEFSPFLRGS